MKRKMGAQVVEPQGRGECQGGFAERAMGFEAGGEGFEGREILRPESITPSLAGASSVSPNGSQTVGPIPGRVVHLRGRQKSCCVDMPQDAG